MKIGGFLLDESRGRNLAYYLSGNKVLGVIWQRQGGMYHKKYKKEFGKPIEDSLRELVEKEKRQLDSNMNETHTKLIDTTELEPGKKF